MFSTEAILLWAQYISTQPTREPHIKDHLQSGSVIPEQAGVPLNKLLVFLEIFLHQVFDESLNHLFVLFINQPVMEHTETFIPPQPNETF